LFGFISQVIKELNCHLLGSGVLPGFFVHLLAQLASFSLHDLLLAIGDGFKS
jgi:hypothetical protein